jgi:hypothetical protein
VGCELWVVGCGLGEIEGGNGIRNWECGLRPIGAYAYAPVGMRKIKARAGRGKMEDGEIEGGKSMEFGIGNAECGKIKLKAQSSKAGKLKRWKMGNCEGEKVC